MGGMGSGNYWRNGGKSCTDDFLALDVRKLQQKGLLRHGASFGWQWTRDGAPFASINVNVEAGQVTLTYRHRSAGDEWKDQRYPVALDWTQCNYGGMRAWFLCPCCGRRVALLYGGKIFACRQCHRLAYRSQREAPYDRLLRRADKIRDVLRWTPGVLNGSEWKPKGMHWKTFERLNEEHDRLVGAGLAGFMLRYKDSGFDSML